MMLAPRRGYCDEEQRTRVIRVNVILLPRTRRAVIFQTGSEETGCYHWTGDG